jgi:hypothetical protein
VQRLSVLQQGMKDMFDRMDAILRQGEYVLAEDPTPNIKELKALLRETRQEQLQIFGPRLNTITNGLAQVAENHKSLYHKHRRFAREMICHFTQQSTFNPNRSGVSMLKNPYVVV